MPVILSRQGAVKMAEYLRSPGGASFLDGMGLALFQNNFIPTVDSVLADFSECTFPGYVPGTLSTLNPAFLNGAGRGEVDADAIDFTSTGPSAQKAFGYFVYDLALDVIWCERFAGPQDMGPVGAILTVTFRATWFTEFTG